MKAGKDSARARGKGCRPYGAYYAPAARIDLVPGVSKSPGSWTWTDRYSGTADALAASGIIPRALMPGEPGAPVGSATYRPEGTPKSEDGWSRTPGYIQLFRNHTGTIRAELTVSLNEQQRRSDGEKRARAEAQRTERAPMRAESPPAEPPPGEVIAAVVERLVRRFGAAEVRLHLAGLGCERRPPPHYLRLVWVAPD